MRRVLKKNQHYPGPEGPDEGKVPTIESTRQPDVGDKRPRDDESEQQQFQDPSPDSPTTRIQTHTSNGPTTTMNGGMNMNPNTNYGASGSMQMMDGMGAGFHKDMGTAGIHHFL